MWVVLSFGKDLRVFTLLAVFGLCARSCQFGRVNGQWIRRFPTPPPMPADVGKGLIKTERREGSFGKDLHVFTLLGVL